ncbi:MAG: hypothetical protein CVU29_02545 [Betaproteobacteria bacterium HGW-Betaproteobacteria-22]|nr:MAG: hypothetical protein CVU29_02545 [Betaproteobacteria bacterium HGW-Betaproteobacteria-22]
MNIFKFIRSITILCCLLSPAIVFADPILDKVEIVQAKTEADIHIDFKTQVRYIRHSPSKLSSRIQIFLEFPEYKKLGFALPTKREFLSSPPTDLVPAFTVNFPDQNTNSIAIRFKSPVKVRISPDGSGRGIVVHVPLPKGIPSLHETVSPKVTASPEVATVEGVQPVDVSGVPEGMTLDGYASKLVAESRAAISTGAYEKAIESLNIALNLPFNNAGEEAQELIGVAREKNGEYAKAKAEYELYLKLYPQGHGVGRVNKQLALVDAVLKAGGGKKQTKKVIKEIHETTVYGSWDQYYYDAHTRTYNPDGRKNKTHDQSSLVSSINLTARTRQNQYDGKIVFRNRQTMDYLPPSNSNRHANRDRTDAAYVEFEDKAVDYMIRAGRQNGNSGGVLGRFDGAWLRYGLTPQYKINVVAGTLDEYAVDYRRHFYGINLDVGPLFENWSGNVFFINQAVKDITDRRAVGGEVRYFDSTRSVYSLLDYDTLYKRVNIAMAQGNWLTDGGINYNFLMDYRNSPILTTVNALTGSALAGKYSTLNRAKRATGWTDSMLQDEAIRSTLQTETVLFGATKQITPRWQLGGDVQVNRTSGQAGASDAAITLFEKQALENGVTLSALEIENFKRSVAGTGSVWTYHVQAVGTNTLFNDDTSVISAAFASGKTSRSQSLLLSNGFAPAEKWRIDSTLQLLRQDSDPNTLTYVISPTMRASYRLREKASLEAEIRFDIDNTHSDDGHTRTLRDAAFIGYRIDI